MSKKKTSLDAVKAETQLCVRFAEPVAAIDIETLGLGLNAVITECSVIVSKDIPLFRDRMTPPSESWFPADSITSSKDYPAFTQKYSVREQILDMGRVIEPDTVKWWANQLRTFPDTPTLSQHFNGDTFVNGATLLKLESALEKASYIWVNHPEFDLPRLENLFGYPVWKNHKKVLDLSYLRKQMKKISDLPQDKIEYGDACFLKHDSFHDCAWNLHQVAHGARLFKEKGFPELLPGPSFEILELT